MIPTTTSARLADAEAVLGRARTIEVGELDRAAARLAAAIADDAPGPDHRLDAELAVAALLLAATARDGAPDRLPAALARLAAAERLAASLPPGVALAALVRVLELTTPWARLVQASHDLVVAHALRLGSAVAVLARAAADVRLATAARVVAVDHVADGVATLDELERRVLAPALVTEMLVAERDAMLAGDRALGTAARQVARRVLAAC